MILTPLSARSARGVTIAGLLPLLWWCATLAAGALGIWYQTIGDIVVTWNLITAAGLIFLVPAAVFVSKSRQRLKSLTEFRIGRGYATAGLVLTVIFCLFVISTPVVNVVSPPVHRDPASWAPALTTSEQWIVAVPYAIMLIPAMTVLIMLWRRRRYA